MDVILFSFISVAIITFLLNFRRLFANYKRDQLINKVPGPRRWPIVGSLLPFITVPRHERFKVYEKFAKMYKDNGFYLVWVGDIPEVRITKCEHAEQIFKSSKHIEKSPTYRFIESWLGKGLITSTGGHWFSHRRLLTPAFHYSILEDFCEVFGDNANVLVKELSEAKMGQEFDIYPYVTKTALDVICETAMGIKLRTLPDNEYIKAVYSYCEIQLHRFFKPWLRPNFIFNWTSMAPTYYKSIDILQGMTRKVIKERKQFRDNRKDEKLSTNDVGIKTRKAFLDLLLDVSNENENFTDQDIIDEVNTFMFAGHDTTSVGICWALYMIGRHPEVQEKLYEEMQQVFGDDKTRIPTYKELNDMKYLERVIKETLRIRPSVPNISRKLSEDIEMNGYKLPAGSYVTLFIYFMHHDERYFPNPEKFDPDRFLPENMENRPSYAFVPFSAGPRNCIGQRFALLEEKALISTIVRNFKITSMQKLEDIHLILELVLRPHEGIKMKFERRT